ncbi:hypothetical protein AAVH_26623 [Aphelenchoides avenae]|nr:hypothetical protein AAVH_26623 [Aphelenchus avenae]
MLAWLFAGLLASAAAAPRSTSSERTEWVYAQGHATVGPHKDGLVVVLEAENMGITFGMASSTADARGSYSVNGSTRPLKHDRYTYRLKLYDPYLHINGPINIVQVPKEYVLVDKAPPKWYVHDFKMPLPDGQTAGPSSGSPKPPTDPTAPTPSIEPGSTKAPIDPTAPTPSIEPAPGSTRSTKPPVDPTAPAPSIEPGPGSTRSTGPPTDPTAPTPSIEPGPGSSGPSKPQTDPTAPTPSLEPGPKPSSLATPVIEPPVPTPVIQPGPNGPDPTVPPIIVEPPPHYH